MLPVSTTTVRALLHGHGPQKVQYRMGSLQLKQIHIIQRGLHLSSYYHTTFVFLTCLLKKKFKSHLSEISFKLYILSDSPLHTVSVVDSDCIFVNYFNSLPEKQPKCRILIEKNQS